jgi:hypothetical protein
LHGRLLLLTRRFHLGLARRLRLSLSLELCLTRRLSLSRL